VNFERDSRQHYLNLLGYSQSSVKSKVTDAMSKLHVSSTSHQQTAVSHSVYVSLLSLTNSTFCVDIC